MDHLRLDFTHAARAFQIPKVEKTEMLNFEKRFKILKAGAATVPRATAPLEGDGAGPRHLTASKLAARLI